jgi:enoyl-CoA hydratase/3-hydroxyacyl-CoA dehydrogenase
MSVRLEKEGGVGIIVLDQPPANSYDHAFLREFASAIDDARLDGEIRNVVVTSASERFFSAGADVGVFAQGTPRTRYMLALLAHEAFRKMEASPLLFIAAISGHCLGGGFELALACDLRFAAEGKYQIGLPEVNLGLFPGSGGTQRLPRLVGEGRARELNLTGDPIPADEAYAFGLANRVVADEELFDTALAWARKLSQQAPLAVERIKRVSAAGDIDAGIEQEKQAFLEVFTSEDGREGVSAFVEKRRPRFRGR